MALAHEVTIDGTTFLARGGELLLDAALSQGIELPYDCRSGHCGTCCVRLVSGTVRGGEGAEPGIVHACQCRIAGDVVIERGHRTAVRVVEGELASLRPLSREVTEVEIRTSQPLPHHAGQYVQVRFSGFPSRPFSITQPVVGDPSARSVYLHVRRMSGGCVTPALSRRIRPGHRVTLTGPFGSAYFRPSLGGRLILVATNTGFAPIWSIAIAALREDPQRLMMVIAGGRAIEALYMGPALARLARFPNVVVVPVCSAPPPGVSHVVRLGRPTDHLPRLLASDVLYACGAPAMVDAIAAIARQVGAVCHADPFQITGDDTAEAGVLTRARDWLSEAAKGRRAPGVASSDAMRSRPIRVSRTAEVGVRGQIHS